MPDQIATMRGVTVAVTGEGNTLSRCLILTGPDRGKFVTVPNYLIQREN